MKRGKGVLRDSVTVTKLENVSVANGRTNREWGGGKTKPRQSKQMRRMTNASDSHGLS